MEKLLLLITLMSVLFVSCGKEKKKKDNCFTVTDIHSCNYYGICYVSGYTNRDFTPIYKKVDRPYLGQVFCGKK